MLPSNDEKPVQPLDAADPSLKEDAPAHAAEPRPGSELPSSEMPATSADLRHDEDLAYKVHLQQSLIAYLWKHNIRTFGEILGINPHDLTAIPGYGAGKMAQFVALQEYIRSQPKLQSLPIPYLVEENQQSGNTAGGEMDAPNPPVPRRLKKKPREKRPVVKPVKTARKKKEIVCEWYELIDENGILNFKLFVDALLAVRPERNVRILIERYGIGEAHPNTLEAIGNKYILTRERIRQLCEAFHDEIRSPLKTKYRKWTVAEPVAMALLSFLEILQDEKAAHVSTLKQLLFQPHANVFQEDELAPYLTVALGVVPSVTVMYRDEKFVVFAPTSRANARVFIDSIWKQLVVLSIPTDYETVLRLAYESTKVFEWATQEYVEAMIGVLDESLDCIERLPDGKIQTAFHRLQRTQYEYERVLFESGRAMNADSIFLALQEKRAAYGVNREVARTSVSFALSQSPYLEYNNSTRTWDYKEQR